MLDKPCSVCYNELAQAGLRRGGASFFYIYTPERKENKMINIAILGFGVVGGGVARLLTDNAKECERLGGDSINIKYILDLRDFPDSPFADKVIHDYSVIVSDPEIDCVIEVMGGSHPAYEFTVAALTAGKSVITSNKEVVANYGDEFLALAEKHGVCYRYEAAVGGGIPVISPMLSCVGQNRLTEVRGILNGTTNYILTKMFSFGAGFEESLADAQERGYAERNPDADVLGYDACRKIAILGAIATGKLVPTDKIHTEGITKIRKADVVAAEKIGYKIKLLGRFMITDDGVLPMVAPFMIPTDAALSQVNGVYNAIEVVGEPIGNVMFYGQGAGAGATASAVVGDLMQVMRSGTHAAAMRFERATDDAVRSFGDYHGRTYVALKGASRESIYETFGYEVTMLEGEERAFITPPLSESMLDTALKMLEEHDHAEILSRIRLL